MAFIYQSTIHGTPRLKQILITKQPNKINYVSGEFFDPTGMEVTAVYSDGSTKIVTNYTYSPTETLSENVSEIIISYTEKNITKTTTLNIAISSQLESIAVTKPPNKIVYQYKDNFNSAGMEVTATYSNGSTKLVSGWIVDTTILNTIGSQTITVTYTNANITKTTTLTVTVNRIKLALPSQSNSLTYNGSSQSPSWNNFDANQLDISGTTSGVNATGYTATFTPRYGYSWADGSTSAKNVNWQIDRAKISTIPSQSGSLTYSGSSQSPSWNNYNSGQLSIGGRTSAVNAGSYTVQFTPTSNYMWNDGTTSAKSVSWTIGKATPTLTLTLKTNTTAITTLNFNSLSQNTNYCLRLNNGNIMEISNKGVPAVANQYENIAEVSVGHSASGSSAVEKYYSALTFKPKANGTGYIYFTSKESANYYEKRIAVTVKVAAPVESEITDSWEVIKQRSQNGTAANYYTVGSWKNITIGGSYAVQKEDNSYTQLGQYYFEETTFRAIILGIDHNKDYETPNGHAIHFYIGKGAKVDKLLCLSNEVYGQGTQMVTMLDRKEFYRVGPENIANTVEHCPLLNMLRNSYNFVSPSDNSPATQSNSYCYTNFINLFPQEIRTNLNTNVIKQADYWSEQDGHSVMSLFNSTFMLLSEKEYLGTSTLTDGNTGRLSSNQKQYDYFLNGNSTEHRRYNNQYSIGHVWTRCWVDNMRGTRGVTIYNNKADDVDSNATNVGFGILFFV